ncbi:hypothetical protein [Desulfovibrio gilichinskyi]|uniref:Uncharacterized protein n=1 Tax=Desulfovibrio gilichinskyi TaxID=1519643 RepID=A0A1X7DC70_9BACT|nr:hypothetical protein [Desulfovibrio gilichinskyi]SMF12631.1 hypothetical protein SAMN06295933_1741 [Desulfovibrio gilichinskyi]
MKEKIPTKFMNSSKHIISDNPDVFYKLQIIMGKVADNIVKNKYVKNSITEEKIKGENEPVD